MEFGTKYNNRLAEKLRETFGNVDTKEFVIGIYKCTDFLNERQADRIKKKYTFPSIETDRDRNDALLDELKKYEGWYEKTIQCLKNECKQSHWATQMEQIKAIFDIEWQKKNSNGNGSLQETVDQSSSTGEKRRLGQVKKTKSRSVLKIKKSSSPLKKNLPNQKLTSKSPKARNNLKKLQSSPLTNRKRKQVKKINSPSVLQINKKKITTPLRKSSCPCGNCFSKKDNRLCCFSIIKHVCKKNPTESLNVCISKWKFIKQKVTKNKFLLDNYSAYSFDTPPHKNSAYFKLACEVCRHYLDGQDIPSCILHEIYKKFPCKKKAINKNAL